MHAAAEGAMIATVIDADRQPSPEGARDEPDRAFADVAREQLDGLYGYCVRLTNDRTDAEDLVQDTLASGHAGIPGTSRREEGEELALHDRNERLA